MVDWTPPADLDAERSVVGCLMLYGSDAVGHDDLSQADFCDKRLGVIFAAAASLIDDGQPCDVTSTKARLAEMGLAEFKATDLAMLLDCGCSPASMPHFAGLVRKAATSRAYHAWLAAELADIKRPGADLDVMRDTMTDDLLAMSEKASGVEAVTMMELVRDHLAILESRQGRGMAGHSTGLPDVDRYLSGLCPGDQIIIAGRPGMGKTAFALGIAQHLGTSEGLPVLVLSLEMSRQALVDRQLSADANVDLTRIRNGTLGPADWPRLMLSMNRMGTKNITITDKAGLTVGEIRAVARKWAARRKVGAVIIDYLQLIEGEGYNRENEISKISRQLKAMAGDLQCPVLSLSQLNRAAENRADKRPQLSDLRESGAIEQDADAVILLFREDYYQQGKDGYTPTNVAEAIIAKNRNGAIGKAVLRWDGERTRFLSFKR